MSDVTCICGKPAAYKVYQTKTRLEADQELKGQVCEDCYSKLLAGASLAQLSEERLNKENQHGKQ